MRLESSITRRAALLTTSALLSLSPTQPALADPRQYIDPQGRFALEIPNGFAQSKRTATTGTIFVAGNFPRAATISVVAWPLQELVAEDVKATSLPGIQPTPPKIPAAPQSLLEVQTALGGETQFFNMILRKRDRESSAGALTSAPLGAPSMTDGHLVWSSTTELPVADPEVSHSNAFAAITAAMPHLLLTVLWPARSSRLLPVVCPPAPVVVQELYRQRGYRQLIRRTTASSWLGTVPGLGGEPAQVAIISMCGSGLQNDWEELGPPIERAVASFVLGSAAQPKS